MTLRKIDENMIDDKFTKKVSDLATESEGLKVSLTETANRIVDIKQRFKAKGDGITDDRAAFQAAVDFLSASGGGTIYAPKGTYLISVPGIKWQKNISLIGAGARKTKFTVSGPDVYNVIYNVDGAPTGSDAANESVWLTDCTFSDFEVDGSGITYPFSKVSGKAFFILYMKRAKFHNLYLHDTIGTALGCDFLVDSVISNVVVERAGRNIAAGPITIGQSGIGIGSCATGNEPVTITNCHVRDCGNYGIFVESQNNPGILSEHARIIANYCDGNRVGIANRGSGGTLIANNSVINSKSNGVELINLAGGNDEILGNKIMDNALNGIFVSSDYAGNVIIANNKVSNNKGKGLNFATTTVTKTIKVANNNIFENGVQGIEFGGGQKSVEILGNSIFNNNKLAVASKYTNGINLSGAIEKFTIANNTIFDDQTVKTQTRGVSSFTGGVLTDGLISNNNIIGYAYAYAVEVSLSTNANVRVSNNDRFPSESHGTATILAGQTSVAIPHGVILPNYSLITPRGNQAIWVSALGNTNLVANRAGDTTAALSFDWIVKR